jgi:hypothetical protein
MHLSSNKFDLLLFLSWCQCVGQFFKNNHIAGLCLLPVWLAGLRNV